MAKLLDEAALGARPTPEAPGGLARYRADMPEREAPGMALSAAGRSLEGDTDKLFAAIKTEQAKVDTLRAEDAYTQLRNQQLQMTFGPGGYATKRGADAVLGSNIQEQGAAFDEAAKKIGDSLTNDDQKRMFKMRADAAGSQYREGYLRHQLQERNVWATDVTNNGVAGEISQISSIYSVPFTDPAAPQNAAIASMLRVKGLLNAHADDLGLSEAGVQNQMKKVADQALTAKYLAWSSWDPVGAYDDFKKDPAQIADPSHRLTMRNTLWERAIPVQVAGESQDLLSKARANQPTEAGPDMGESTFKAVVGSLLKREGGYVAKDGKSGAPANFGINQRANPDIDVSKLTQAKAVEIYRDRYWNKIGGDNLSPATALVALDTAALQGVEVAKKLLTDTAGDPQAMIEQRRAQLTTLAARDPGQAANLPGWLSRLDGLQAEVAIMPEGGMRRTSATDRVLAPNTSPLPTARNIAAQLPMALMQVDKRATELYGADPRNADRAAFVKLLEADLRARNAHDVQLVQNQQREALQTVGNIILGPVLAGGAQAPGLVPAGGAPGAVPAGGAGGGAQRGMLKMTSFTELMQNPQAAAAYQLLDFEGKKAVDTMLKVNANDSDRGDPALFNELRNSIAEGKINWNDQITKDPRVQAGNLNITQLNFLRGEVDRQGTEDGRTQGALVKNGTRIVRALFQGDMVLTNAGTDKGRADVAEELFSRNAAKVVADYRRAGKDVSELFDITNPKSLIYPPNLEQWKVLAKAPATTADMLADMAEKAKAGQGPAASRTAEIPQAPVTITDKASADAFLKANPGAQFVKPPGWKEGEQVIKNPYFAPNAAAAPAAAVQGTAPVPSGTPPSPVREVPVKPKGEIPEFAGSRGRASADDQARIELHQQGLWEAVKAVNKTFVNDPLISISQAPRKFIGWMIGLAQDSRQDVARATFHKLTEGPFYAEDVPIIEAAVKYGNLDPADLKTAKAMLKKAGVK